MSEREELLMLRQLVQKQKEELEKKMRSFTGNRYK